MYTDVTGVSDTVGELDHWGGLGGAFVRALSFKTISVSPRNVFRKSEGFCIVQKSLFYKPSSLIESAKQQKRRNGF